jgi:small-conductance mechanosensitive channel/CRP-like cAMP-binding protein
VTLPDFHDPKIISLLGAAPVVYFGGLALGRWLKRRQQIALGLAYHWLLAVAALFLVAMAVLPSSPLARVLVSAIIILGTYVALAFVRRLFWELWFEKHYGSKAPKLLQQVFSFGVMTTVVLSVLSNLHAVKVDTFLAGSGLAAVVLGFAMQETLANIVSGIAIQIGKPFKAGDWLIVTNIRAEVTEVNWRSTRLRTNDDVYLDIPNKTMVTSTITNLSFPTKTHSNRLRVGFEYGTPPNIVRDLLRKATEAVPLVLPSPPVKVFLRDFAESAMIYEIKYSLDDEARFNDIEDAIRTNIWYAAKRAGLNIPLPQRVIHKSDDDSAGAGESESLRTAASQIALLAPLTDAQRERLVANASIVQFGRGETVIKQGFQGCSMFIVLRGELEVIVNHEGEETRVATLPAGEAFGEMCMLTGEPRTATVRALTDSLVWEIRRAELQPILQENSGLATQLSELLARRKCETDGILAAHHHEPAAPEKTQEYATGILHKIRSLFEI